MSNRVVALPEAEVLFNPAILFPLTIFALFSP